MTSSEKALDKKKRNMFWMNVSEWMWLYYVQPRSGVLFQQKPKYGNDVIEILSDDGMMGKIWTNLKRHLKTDSVFDQPEGLTMPMKTVLTDN